MARRVVGVLAVVSVIAVVSVWVRAQPGSSGVEGAWVLQEYSFAKPAPFQLNKPTGMMLFTGNHYAFVILRDSSPRPEVGPGGDKATADQLRTAWGPLQAQAGTFKVSGNTLTMRATVAKGTIPMTPGNFSENTLTLKGDTMVLVSTRNQAGPTENPRTYRLTRAK